MNKKDMKILDNLRRRSRIFGNPCFKSADTVDNQTD